MVRMYSRLNGWMPPPHPLQVMAWFMVLCLTASTFGILAPSFASLTIRITVYVAMALMIFVNILANIVVTTIDPSDDAVKKKIRNNPRPGFDRDKHRHVIDENYFCNICETIIQPSSKHCRQCNKCVLDFDHHCKWLNNCIGEKNYRWFLFYVVSSVLTSLSIFGLSLALFVLQFVDRSTLNQEGDCLTIFGLQTKDAVWLTFVAVTIFVSAIAFLLLMHLLIFHLRIIKKGMTTYNYIMEQRKKDEQREKQKAEAAAALAAQVAASTITSNVRLFSQTKMNPVTEQSIINEQKNKTVQSIIDRQSTNNRGGRLKKLKQLLRLKKESRQSAGQQTGHLATAALPPRKSSSLAQDFNTLPKRKLALHEELVMVDPSSDTVKSDETKEDKSKKIANGKNSSRRSTTPLPPIVHAANKNVIAANGAGARSPAIASFIQTPTRGNNSDSNARKKKRLGAGGGVTSIQSPVPYEIMEDKENRISVSHIAATLPSDNGNRSKNNNGRSDSASASAYSRHTDVPRLPPLPLATATFQNGKPTLIVPGANQMVAESLLLRRGVSSDDLNSSFNLNSSSDRRDDDTLREIPLTSFAPRRSPPAPVASLRDIAPPTAPSQRTSSGSSTGSSGSILAPLQADALSTPFPNVDHVGASVYSAGGRYFGQRMRSLPPLVAGRHHETLLTMGNDHDSRFSDSGSLSSGSKRVRFGGSPNLRKNNTSVT